MRFASISRNRAPASLKTALAIGAVIVIGCAVHARAQTRFRSETDLVALQVTVVDPQRRYVPNLRAEDFDVFDEGVRQTISLFAAGTAPLDLMLLLDTSASMFGRLPTVQKAASNFVRALRPDDRAEIVLFNQRVQVTQSLTSDRDLLARAIREAAASGKTALYEALYIALKELVSTARREESLRRQAIVVLTDGDDTTSLVDFSDVLRDVRRTSVTIYAIVPPDDGMMFDDRRQWPRLPFDLRRLAEESGGRAFVPGKIEDLPSVYDQIAEELSHQYWLAFVPTSWNGEFRRVSVRIATKPTLQARTRSGYLAAGALPGAAGGTRNQR